jgi:hypothetical protein
MRLDDSMRLELGVDEIVGLKIVADDSAQLSGSVMGSRVIVKLPSSAPRELLQLPRRQ